MKKPLAECQEGANIYSVTYDWEIQERLFAHRLLPITLHDFISSYYY